MGNLEHQENLTLEPKTDSRFHTIRLWTLRTTVLLGALLNDADRANAQPPQIPAPPPAAEICDDECQPTEAGKKEECVLMPHPAMTLPYSPKEIRHHTVPEYTSWKDWDESLMKNVATLEQCAARMDDPDYFVRKAATEDAILTLECLQDECNPLPLAVENFLALYKSKDGPGLYSLEQRKRLELTEQRIRGRSVYRPGQLPACVGTGSELIAFMEKNFGSTFTYEDEELRSALLDQVLCIQGNANEAAHCLVELFRATGITPEQNDVGAFHLRRTQEGEYLYSSPPYIVSVRQSSPGEFDVAVLHDPSGACVALRDGNVQTDESCTVRVRIPHNRIESWESTNGSTNLKTKLSPKRKSDKNSSLKNSVQFGVVAAVAPITQSLEVGSRYYSHFGVQEMNCQSMVEDTRMRVGISEIVFHYLTWPATSAEADTWTYRLADSSRFTLQFADGTSERVTPDRLQIDKRELDLVLHHSHTEDPKTVEVQAFQALRPKLLTIPLSLPVQGVNTEEHR